MNALRLLRSLLAAGVALLALAAAAPALADNNVVHVTAVVNGTSTFPLGPEAACFGVPTGTNITITDMGEIHFIVFVAGPNVGSIHGHGHISATFVVTATGTTGSIEQSLNFRTHRNTSGSADIVHVTGTFTDGSDLRALFHRHLVLRDGEAHLENIRLECIQP